MAKIINFEESKKLKTLVNPESRLGTDQEIQRLLMEMNEMQALLESHFKRTAE